MLHRAAITSFSILVTQLFNKYDTSLLYRPWSVSQQRLPSAIIGYIKKIFRFDLLFC